MEFLEKFVQQMENYIISHRHSTHPCTAREVDILTKVARAGADLHKKFRSSKLVALVVPDDSKDTLGLTISKVDTVDWGLAQSLEVRRKRRYYVKWRRPVFDAFMDLHTHGIVWGDVHQGNIVIDTQMNVWVVEFGGGRVEPFVNRRIYDTTDGDSHGIEKAFEHLSD